MPVDNQKLEHTKTVILALLVSRKRGCTLQQLDRDYFEEEGNAIPFTTFGYPSLLSFIQSIPKIARLEFQNNMIFVSGVPSDRSKHIKSLVAGQKTQAKNPIYRKTFRPTHYFPTTAPHRVQVPAGVLAAVVDLVNRHPKGLSKSDVLTAMQSNMRGTYVSMADMEQQLQQLSHKIVVLDNKIYPVKLQPNVEIASRDIWNLSSTAGQTEQQSQPEANPVQCYAAGSEDFQSELDFVNDTDDDLEFLPVGYTKNLLHWNQNTAGKEPISSDVQETVPKRSDQRALDELLNTEKAQNDENTLYNFSNCNNNDAKRDTESNININYETDGYDRDGIDMLISDRTKFRLEKLIQKYPEGIWCADLPEKYLEEYKISLNYTELGFHSVREFAAHLPVIFHCEQPYDTADFKLYYAKNKTPSDLKRERQKPSELLELYNMLSLAEEAEPLPTMASADTCRELIPNDVMTLRESVGQIHVEGLGNHEKPYVEVVVVEVFNPSFFWIQLRKTQKIFKTLMDDLHAFYTVNSQNYTIPPIVLERGLNCACTYNGKWHRGIIKSVKPDLQVTVLFYDYGTLKTYPAEAIHYLRRAFSNLPAQAIPCCLFNTRPRVGNKWSQTVTHEFAIRTSDVPLIATIASREPQDNSMMVTLTDTTDEEEDVHINDWLVEKKLAIHGKMVRIKSRNYPFRHYIECKRHLKQDVEAWPGASNVSNENKLIDRNDSCVKKDEVASYEKTEAPRSIFSNDSLGRLANGEWPKLDVSANERSLSLLARSESDSSHSPKNSHDVTKFREKLLSLRRPFNSTRNTASNREDRNDNSVKGLANRRAQLEELSKANAGGLREASSKASFIPSYDADLEEDEAIDCYRMCSNACKRQHGFNFVDWSMVPVKVVEPVSKTSEDVPKKSTEEVPRERPDVQLAESCFLEIVRSSVHYKPLDEHVGWLPNGNLTETRDTSEVMVRRLKEVAADGGRRTIVAIPQRVLERLRGKPLSADDLNRLTESSENPSKMQERSYDSNEIELLIDEKLSDVATKHFEGVSPPLDDRKTDAASLHSDEPEKEEPSKSGSPISPDTILTDTADRGDAVSIHSAKSENEETIESPNPSVIAEATEEAPPTDKRDATSVRSDVEKSDVLEIAKPGAIAEPEVSVPVFNDVDFELDDEEWEIQGDTLDFFRRQPAAAVEACSDEESGDSDARVRIVEINDADSLITEDRFDGKELEKDEGIEEMRETELIGDSSEENLIDPAIGHSENTESEAVLEIAERNDTRLSGDRNLLSNCGNDTDNLSSNHEDRIEASTGDDRDGNECKIEFKDQRINVLRSNDDANALQSCDDRINRITEGQRDNSECQVESNDICRNDLRAVDGADSLDRADSFDASSKEHPDTAELEIDRKVTETNDSRPVGSVTSLNNLTEQDSAQNGERPSLSVPKSTNETASAINENLSCPSAKVPLVPYNPKGISRSLVEMLNKLKVTV